MRQGLKRLRKNSVEVIGRGKKPQGLKLKPFVWWHSAGLKSRSYALKKWREAMVCGAGTRQGLKPRQFNVQLIGTSEVMPC
jgi:hypothetical protein